MTLDQHSTPVRLLLPFLLLLLTTLACGLPGAEPVAAPPEVVTVVVIATDVVIATEAPREEPLPGEPVLSSEEEETAVTDAPVLELPPVSAGQPTMTALVDLNVRRGPGTGYAIVGVLRAGSSAPVIGRNNNGTWWKIDCPPGVSGDCWVSGGHQFSTAENVTNVLVVAAPPLPTHSASTATPEYTPSATATPYAAATATYYAAATATQYAAATATAAAAATAAATMTPYTEPTYTYTPTIEPTYTYTPAPYPGQ